MHLKTWKLSSNGWKHWEDDYIIILSRCFEHCFLFYVHQHFWHFTWKHYKTHGERLRNGTIFFLEATVKKTRWKSFMIWKWYINLKILLHDNGGWKSRRDVLKMQFWWFFSTSFELNAEKLKMSFHGIINIWKIQAFISNVMLELLEASKRIRLR